MTMRRITIYSFILAIALSAATSAEAWRNGGLPTFTYGNSIVADPTLVSNAQLSPAITDLQNYLNQITGATFTVASSGTTPGIFISLAGSPQAPSDMTAALSGKAIDVFNIRDTSGRLDIVSNDVQGLATGIYYYLDQLGVRWLFPNDKWTIVPHLSNIRLIVNSVVAPVQKVRSYAGTGGFYSNSWGRNYAQSATNETNTTNWQSRIRYGGGTGFGEYQLGKDVGGAFFTDPANQATFTANPSYAAIIGGTPSPISITAKVNAGNPSAVSFFCNWVLNTNFIPARSNPDASYHNITSVEPSDGPGYGDNISALVAAGVGNGSGSDQSFYIANQCATTIAAAYPGTSVILLAYYGHSAPTSIPLPSNVFVELDPYGFQYGFPPERYIELWKPLSTRFSMYDYWGIPDWDHDLPDFDYVGLGARLNHWYADTIEGINSETTYGAGPLGIAYYIASHIAWNSTANETTLLAEWYNDAFGPAAAPMQRMLERWSRHTIFNQGEINSSYSGFILNAGELGQSYSDLQQAISLASGNPAALSRVLDFGRYLHYMRLHYELLSQSDPSTAYPLSSTDTSAESNLAVAYVEYMLDIAQGTMLLHTTRDIDLVYKDFNAIYSTANFDLTNSASPGAGWARVHQLTDSQIATMVASDAALYPLPSYTVKTFSGPLTPVNPITWTPPTGSPWGTNMAVAGLTYVNVRIPTGLTALPLEISREQNCLIDVIDSTGATVYETTITGVATGGSSTYQDLSISLAAGDYQVVFFPSQQNSDGTYVKPSTLSYQVKTYKGVPFILTTFLVPKPWPSPRLYFYVPHGTPNIVMSYPIGWYNNAYGFQVLKPDGTAATIALSDSDGHGTPYLGNIALTMTVTVPPGMDGQIWSLQNSVSPNAPAIMLNVPQAFSLEPGVLMVPSSGLP